MVKMIKLNCKKCKKIYLREPYNCENCWEECGIKRCKECGWLQLDVEYEPEYIYCDTCLSKHVIGITVISLNNIKSE